MLIRVFKRFKELLDAQENWDNSALKFWRTDAGNTKLEAVDIVPEMIGAAPSDNPTFTGILYSDSISATDIYANEIYGNISDLDGGLF